MSKIEGVMEIEAIPVFNCQQCLKTFIPKANLHLKVYEGQALCMMCRKANGQQEFTSDENLCLFAEEKLTTP